MKVVEHFHCDISIVTEKYINALNLMSYLLEHDLKCIKHIRKIKPNLKIWTAKDILEAVPDFPKEKAKKLCTQFYEPS